MSNPAIERLVAKLEQLPAERVAQVIDFVDSLTQRQQPIASDLQDFPVISVGEWPKDLSLHREAMYGDDGR